jgi:hypothetical protein
MQLEVVLHTANDRYKSTDPLIDLGPNDKALLGSIGVAFPTPYVFDFVVVGV